MSIEAMNSVLILLDEINTVRSKDRSKLMRAKNKLKEAIKSTDEVELFLMLEGCQSLEDKRYEVGKILSLSIVLIYVLILTAIFVREFF